MSWRARRAVEGALVAWAIPLGWAVFSRLFGAVETAASFALYVYLVLASVSALAAFGWFAGRREARLRRANAELDVLALTDATTGLKNKRYFQARLAEALARVERDDEPVALAMIDLDRFKSVNDRHGHAVGDRVLGAAAAAIASVCRRHETAARVGGEEFAVILPGSDAKAALAAAERIRRAIADAVLVIEDHPHPIRITASVGVASTAEIGSTRSDVLYAAADGALLVAKNQGRNRCVAIHQAAPRRPRAVIA